jgi:glycerol kinase
MAFLLALDQGTTSSRAIVFDESGAVVAAGQREHRQYYPQPGWVEHDAEEIWTSQLAVAEGALSAAKLRPADVAAIGITNQRETVVAWDRDSGRPVHRAVVWQDRRTADHCQRLRSEGKESAVVAKTGLLLDPYFSGTKIAWLLRNVPEAAALAAKGRLAVGTIDSWLVYRLTGGRLHVTDSSNASRTQLYNIVDGDWDDQLLSWYGVPREALADVRGSSEQYATVDAKLPLGGIPIAGIAGDQQSALFGQTCFQRGLAKNTYGTGCFMLMNVGPQAIPSTNRLLTTVAWTLDGSTEYALEGSVFIGGAVVGWLRDALGIIKSSKDVEALAATVPDSGGVFFVPAFAGLGAPHWDPHARGAIVGLTQGSTKAHIARAAVDSIALQVADLMEAMQNDSLIQTAQLRVDGGAAVNDALMQRQADLLQVSVVRPQVTETTALGAAYLAGLAVGVWPDRQSLARQWKIERQFDPRISGDEAAQVRAQWRRAVQRAAAWAADA